ncbi:FRG domain [Lelliottia amnigena]|uniref:FRG domain-containing protein n=1 Tax=Lelliottia amnigena TaxID=61646 RepID=UPI0007441140|nr:FRG domain-containing protein [Lelliottia amnigena]ATG02114.1 FRG domain-containing protein [Lelliottia amnigena]QXA22425.1 FRG domain-containing protein [Lelliottia amnigena]VDZ90228.1 FRG domain [Lelliottia amnigena]
MIESLDFVSIDEMFEFFSPWGESSNLEGFIFRGHSQESYELIPTALRLNNIDWFWKTCGLGRPIEPQHNWQSWQVKGEYSVLRAFYRLADQRGLDVPTSDRMRVNLAQQFDIHGLNTPYESDIWIPKDLLETAALAQHYGIPTRLLDWTYDIFVALFFALRGAFEKEGRLEIWALNKEYISFLKPTVNRINIDFITPHYANNPNLNAQKGLFTHWPIQLPSMINEMQLLQNGLVKVVDRRPLDALVADTYKKEENIVLFKRFTLPCSQAKKGSNILSKLGYDAARIFPGYKGVAEHILTQYKLH